MNSEPVTTRDNILVEDLVLIDGQPGCGKTLFTAIVAAMERVELLNYSPELENICALRYLDKMSDDAAKTMLRIQMDLVLYETMMSRRTNFRPSDLSSAFKDTNCWTYIKRLFLKGDEVIPERIKKERPILHFATHNLLPFSAPIFASFGNKVKIIEIVRHPLYMIIQQTLNQERWIKPEGIVRQFHLHMKFKEHQVPYHTRGWEELYINSNPVERAIYEIDNIFELTETFKKNNEYGISNQILTIPFEKFVINPLPYMQDIEHVVDTKITQKTQKIMKKQNVPREKISDGIPLSIYKRCGWQPPEKGLSEKDELQLRRQYALKHGAGNDAMKVLDRICEEYESKYL